MTIISGGVWFKDHCLKITPNKQTGGVRYRHPDEDWILVESGDDFTRSQSFNCSGGYDINLYVRDSYQFYNREPGVCYRITDGRPRHKWYLSENYINDHEITGYEIRVPNNPETDPYNAKGIGQIEIKLSSNKTVFPWSAFGGRCSHVKISDWTSGKIKYEAVNRDYPEENCTSYVLKIFKQGKLLQEIESESELEAELIDGNCVEDEPIKIELETAPLGFIDVTKVATDATGKPEAAVPDECVNIYKVDAIHSLISPSGALPALNYTLIGQYCSSPDCESPTVIRDGDSCGESCPDGTCASICGDHICCHDSNGIAVQEIPLENYAGGEL